MNNIQLSVKAIDRENGIIEGLGIPFGGSLTNESGKKCDLEGEYFDDRTDFTSAIYDGKAIIGTFPVMYHHGMDVVLGKSIIGKVLSISNTDKGKWFRMQLDKAHEYYQYLLQLAELGALTLSTGADSSQSIRKADDGHIIKWPLKEISLTPSAMNPDAQLAIKALNQSILKEQYMTKKAHFKKYQCRKASDKETETALIDLDKNTEKAMTDDLIENEIVEESITAETDADKTTFDKSEDTACDNDKSEDTLKTEIVIPENEKDSLIQNLATISDALQSVITSLGAVAHPITVDNAKDLENKDSNEDEDIEDNEILMYDDSENSDEEQHEIAYAEEINQIKNDIDEIKKIIGYDQKARKAITNLKAETDKELSDIKSSVSDLLERINILESSSVNATKPITYAENSRISHDNARQKALNQLINSDTLSEPVKSELSRQCVLTDLDDLLRTYTPKY